MDEGHKEKENSCLFVFVAVRMCTWVCLCVCGLFLVSACLCMHVCICACMYVRVSAWIWLYKLVSMFFIFLNFLLSLRQHNRFRDVCVHLLILVFYELHILLDHDLWPKLIYVVSLIRYFTLTFWKFQVEIHQYTLSTFYWYYGYVSFHSEEK